MPHTEKYRREVNEMIERANKRLREIGYEPPPEDEDDEGMGVLIGYKRPKKPRKDD
jgi:hypothetical protein